MTEGKVQITDRGLLIKEPLSEGEWQALGLRLARAQRAHRWVIGDWWRAHRGEERARVRFLLELEMDLKTVQNIASVCAAYPLEERFPELPMSFHEAVMTLPKEARQRLLAQALEEGLTVSELRERARAEGARRKGFERVKAATPAPSPGPEPKPEPDEPKEGALAPGLRGTQEKKVDPKKEETKPLRMPLRPQISESVRPTENGGGFEHSRYPNVARVLFRNGRIILWNPSAHMTPDEARALAEVLLAAAEALEGRPEEVVAWR
jgi:hypothetical protein